uniref:Uncharacterized protein n=1 Tax=Avena sativa TaxID=4498 RepID=A0ACD5V2M1_AVESA
MPTTARCHSLAIRKFKAKSSRPDCRFDQSQPHFTSMCKAVNPVQSIVWLRRAVRRWRSRTAASVRPAANKEYTADAAVPAGHVAVRVEGRAGDSRRFVVRLAQLSHPAFLDLLRQAEEEYGFASTSGPLVLPCDEDRLRDVLRRVSSSSGSEERRSRDSRVHLASFLFCKNVQSSRHRQQPAERARHAVATMGQDFSRLLDKTVCRSFPRQIDPMSN